MQNICFFQLLFSYFYQWCKNYIVVQRNIYDWSWHIGHVICMELQDLGTICTVV